MPENNQTLPTDNSLYFFHATRVYVSVSMLSLRCAISLFLSNTQTAVVILSMWFQHIPIRRILFKELSASEREQFNHRSLSINIGVAFYYEFVTQLVKLTDVKAPRMSFYVLAIASVLCVTWISIHFERALIARRCPTPATPQEQERPPIPADQLTQALRGASASLGGTQTGADPQEEKEEMDDTQTGTPSQEIRTHEVD